MKKQTHNTIMTTLEFPTQPSLYPDESSDSSAKNLSRNALTSDTSGFHSTWLYSFLPIRQTKLGGKLIHINAVCNLSK